MGHIVLMFISFLAFIPSTLKLDLGTRMGLWMRPELLKRSEKRLEPWTRSLMLLLRSVQAVRPSRTQPNSSIVSSFSQWTAANPSQLCAGSRPGVTDLVSKVPLLLILLFVGPRALVSIYRCLLISYVCICICFSSLCPVWAWSSGTAKTARAAGQLHHRASGGFLAQNSPARSQSQGKMALFPQEMTPFIRERRWKNWDADLPIC